MRKRSPGASSVGERALTLRLCLLCLSDDCNSNSQTSQSVSSKYPLIGHTTAKLCSHRCRRARRTHMLTGSLFRFERTNRLVPASCAKKLCDISGACRLDAIAANPRRPHCCRPTACAYVESQSPGTMSTGEDGLSYSRCCLPLIPNTGRRSVARAADAEEVARIASFLFLSVTEAMSATFQYLKTRLDAGSGHLIARGPVAVRRRLSRQRLKAGPCSRSRGAQPRG